MQRRSVRSRSRDGDVLRGQVVSVFFPRPGESWGIAKIRGVNESEAQAISMTGTLLGVSIGDAIEAKGEWSTHPRFGRQFRAAEVQTVVPSDASGIVAWMTSRLPFLGDVRARAVVERFGADEVFCVIEETPQRLLEVEGVTEKRLDAIVKAYREHRANRDVLVELRRFGLTDNQSARVMKKYDDPLAALREDPYRLASEVDGFGFVRADDVARRMGVPPTSIGRVRAGILHALDQARQAGHCYVTKFRMIDLCSQKLLGIPAEFVADGIDSFASEDELTARVLADGERLYLRSILDAEKSVASIIAEKIRATAA